MIKIWVATRQPNILKKCSVKFCWCTSTIAMRPQYTTPFINHCLPIHTLYNSFLCKQCRIVWENCTGISESYLKAVIHSPNHTDRRASYHEAPSGWKATYRSWSALDIFVRNACSIISIVHLDDIQRYVYGIKMQNIKMSSKLNVVSFCPDKIQIICV